MNKKAVAPLFIFAILGLVGAIALGVVSVGDITGSGSYIQRPVFYYDKCEQVSSLRYSSTNTFNDNWAVKPSVSDQYSVIVKQPSSLGIRSVGRLTYSVCNSRLETDDNCRIFKSEVDVRSENFNYQINNVRNNEYVHLLYEKSSFVSYTLENAKYQIAWQPYGIRQYNILSGSSKQINPNSCTYPSNPDDTILSSDSGKIRNRKPEGRVTNERTLQPNEVRWYVAGYLTSAEPSFRLRYKGVDAWCRQTGSNAEIYRINEIRTTGGTYKIASPDWSDFLGSETCCPNNVKGDRVCNDNFEYEQIRGSECGAFRSCGSSDYVPKDSGTLVRYYCDNGFCKEETKEVECTSDFDCSDSNEVCDLNTYTCERANVNLDGDEIETIPDSEQECIEAGGTWKTVQTEDSSFLNFLGFGEPDIITEEYCEFYDGINWVLWILIVVGALLFFLFRNQVWAVVRSVWNTTIGRLGVRI